MIWIRRLLSKEHRRSEDPVFRDKVHMLMEVRRAHADWTAAHAKLGWAMDKDQVDYAIYSLEAAEKRYEMLLRQAKQLEWEDGLLVATHVHRMEPRRYRAGEHGVGDGSHNKASGY